MDTQFSADDPLGTDLALDEHGDLLTSIFGSLATVTGQDNVAQATRVNVMTIPYTYLWGNNVGTRLAEYIDEPLTDALMAELKDIVQEAVTADPRLLQVLDVHLEQASSGVLAITIRAVVAAVGPVEIPIIIRR